MTGIKPTPQLAGRKFEPAPLPQTNTANSQPIVVTRRPQKPQSTTIDDRYIIGGVRFNADPGSAYYVTMRYNLVKVDNNRLSVIGKLAHLNSNRFPYLIYDEENTQLLVDAYGNIITKQGRPVGKLSAGRG